MPNCYISFPTFYRLPSELAIHKINQNSEIIVKSDKLYKEIPINNYVYPYLGVKAFPWGGDVLWSAVDIEDDTTAGHTDKPIMITWPEQQHMTLFKVPAKTTRIL